MTRRDAIAAALLVALFVFVWHGVLSASAGTDPAATTAVETAESEQASSGSEADERIAPGLAEIAQYAGIGLVLAVALLETFKDWKKTRLLHRRLALGLALAGGAVSLVATFLASRDAEGAAHEAAVKHKALVTEVTTTRNVLAKQNERLYGQVLELEKKVATEPLRAELARTRAELERANVPPPKAKFVFGLVEPDEELDPNSPRTSTSVPVILGIAAVSIKGLNATTVFASDVEVWVRICERCTFAEEPPQFSTTLQRPYDRSRRFGPIAGSVGVPRIDLKVRPPAGGASMLIRVSVACPECGPLQETPMTVRLTRPFDADRTKTMK